MRKQYKEKNKEWRLKNKEHINVYSQEYRKKNKEKLNKYRKDYYEKNKKHLLELRKTWCKNNPEKLRKIQKKRYIKHREILLNKSKEYRKNNIEKIHITKIKRKFGITEKEYLDLRKEQNDKCAICLGIDKNQRLGVDHNHKTKKIRGLLCTGCNTGIGGLQDSIELLKNAINYLKKYEDKTTI